MAKALLDGRVPSSRTMLPGSHKAQEWPEECDNELKVWIWPQIPISMSEYPCHVPEHVWFMEAPQWIGRGTDLLRLVHRTSQAILWCLAPGCWQQTLGVLWPVRWGLPRSNWFDCSGSSHRRSSWWKYLEFGGKVDTLSSFIPFLSIFCSVAGCIVLLWGPLWCAWFLNSVWFGGVCKEALCKEMI